MSNDNDYTAPNTAGRGYVTEAESRASMNEANRMADLGRRMDAENRRVANLPDPVPAAPDYAAMVPPEHRHDPEAYLNAMIGKADGAANPRHLDSTKVGALPVDPNILSDARSYGGRPLTASELTPDSTVAYMGTRMSVEQAVQQELLEVTENGKYRVPDASARKAQQRQQELEQKAGEQAQLSALVTTGDAPDDAASQVVDLVSQHVPAQATAALVHDYVSNNGTISTANIAKVAQSIGWTTEQAQGAVLKLQDGLTRQAAAAAVHAGVPADEVQEAWNWAAQHDPAAHINAARALIMGSDSRGLKALAKRYLAHKRDVARR